MELEYVIIGLIVIFICSIFCKKIVLPKIRQILKEKESTKRTPFDTIKREENERGIIGAESKTCKDVYTVFFCWQSDIKGQKEIIEKEIKKLRINLKKNKKGYKIELDKDTSNVPGMRSIVSEVFKKIEKCDIFICDLTPVTILDTNGRKKAMPNSNVMFELGYAMKCMQSSDQIIGIVNTNIEEWNVGEMPLDIRGFKLIEFSSSDKLHSLLSQEIKYSLDSITNSPNK